MVVVVSIRPLGIITFSFAWIGLSVTTLFSVPSGKLDMCMLQHRAGWKNTFIWSQKEFNGVNQSRVARDSVGHLGLFQQLPRQDPESVSTVTGWEGAGGQRGRVTGPSRDTHALTLYESPESQTRGLVAAPTTRLENSWRAGNFIT